MVETSPRLGRRRSVLRYAALTVAILLVPVTWSYVGALRAPGTDSVAARSTEWLRGHGFGGLINHVEEWWYTHHPPKVGGTPRGGIPHVPKVATNAPHSTTHTTVPAVGLPAPPTVVSPASPALAGEGVWKPTGMLVRGRPAMYVTYVRPDPVHTSYLTSLVWFDTRLLHTMLIPGLQEPSGAPNLYGADVPDAQRSTLVGAFNSGFRVQDSQGGYFLAGHTYAPLLLGRAAAVITNSGTMKIGEWGRDFTSTAGLQSVRENLWPIIDQGQVVPGLPVNHSAKWGATLGAKVYVWR